MTAEEYLNSISTRRSELFRSKLLSLINEVSSLFVVIHSTTDILTDVSSCYRKVSCSWFLFPLPPPPKQCWLCLLHCVYVFLTVVSPYWSRDSLFGIKSKACKFLSLITDRVVCNEVKKPLCLVFCRSHLFEC